MLQNYDPRTECGIHTIEVTIQQWDYVGHMTFIRGGNCHGLNAITVDFEYDMQPEENDCDFEFRENGENEEYFKVALTNQNGEKLIVTGNYKDFNDMIVKIELKEYEEIK